MVLAWALLCLAGWAPAPARAADLELPTFDVIHNEEGVLVNFVVDMELSRSVDDALSKAQPLFFVAEAEVFRNRFYWRDLRVGYAVRRWRIEFKPLTSTYRVTFDGGLSQNYLSKAEALDAIGRSVRWKVAEPGQVDDGNRHYIEFSFRLDTAQLPRALQIGIGGQADWSLSVRRSQKIN